MRSTLVGLVLPFLLSPLSAQGPGPANLELAQAGVGVVLAGTPCGPFSCTPSSGTVHSAIGAELRVWGQPGWIFAVAGSVSPPACIPFVGFAGQLVLTPPAITLAVGTLPQGPTNSCGLVQAPPIPLQFSSRHAQLSFLFQAVTFIPVPAALPGAFSPAIQAFVRS